MTTTPETTIKFDVFEHWVRSYVDDTLRARNLNNAGESYYHEWGQRMAAAARMASLLADLFAYSDINARDTLDRLVDAVKDLRFDDLHEAGEHRFNRIMAEARYNATVGILDPDDLPTRRYVELCWIDALEYAMDEFGVPTLREAEWIAQEAKWAKEDAAREASQMAASSGTVSV